MKPERIAVFVVLFIGVIAVPALAQGNGPGFHASANFGDGCSGLTTTSSATPPAATGPITTNCVSGSAAAEGEADAGTLRASGRSTHGCCGTTSTATGRARIQIENVIISGPPAASIPVSINFQLRGRLERNDDQAVAVVMLFTALRGFNTSLSVTSELYMSPTSIVNQTGVFAPLNVPFPNATIDQAFTTPVANATPNVPLQLDFELMAWSSMPGTGTSDSDFSSETNGFSLPVGIPVFNLPEGYTINIPELNIVDNLWQADVPPAVSVTPASVNFGSVAVGSQSTSLVTVTNTGGPGLHVTFVQQSPVFSPFSVVSLAKNGANVVLPVALDTNETLDVEVAFTPGAPGAATGTLIVESDAPGQGPVGVPLSGEGVQVELPPSDQIAELLAFFDSSVVAGTLEGAGQGNSAAGRLKALRNMIQAAADFITQASFVQACHQLQDVLDRIDGLPRPPDFAGGAAVEELRSRITDLRAALGCP
jgi:hypothetical protein